MWARGLVVTCEHASNAIPPHLRAAFAAGEGVLGAPAHAVLAGHRGYDPGAQALAQALSKAAGCVPLLGQVSRLVIDLNRSLGHPKLFSPVTRALSVQDRAQLQETYWRPHVQAVQAEVAQKVCAPGGCVHLAMHSFTPVWGQTKRDVDVGVLYDPKKPNEKRMADALMVATKQALPELRVRRNQPYRGTADGLPTQLRRIFAAGAYAGLEIEVSQALVHNRRRWPVVAAGLVTAWQQALVIYTQASDSF